MKEFSKDFKLMILGQVISLFGASILRFALSLYILKITGSATIFGTLLGISVIPTIFLSPIGGVIADRYNRRNLMVIFDCTSSLIVAVFAILLFTGHTSVLGIGLLMTFLSIISAMYQPAVQSSIPVLVPETLLLKSNGISTGVMSISNFLGPIIGGILFSITRIEMIVVISSVSFLLAGVMEIFIHIPYEKSSNSQQIMKMIIHDMKDGIAYIVHANRFILKTIGIACIINLFVAPVFFVGLPYIIKVMLKMPDIYYGFAQAGMSLSVIFSAMTVGILKDKIHRNNLHFWISGCALIFVLMAFGTSGILSNKLAQYLISSISAIWVMFSLTVVNIYVMTLIQKDTPTPLLGKVMSIQTAVVMTAMPIGQILIGFLVDSFSNKIYLLILGVGFFTWVTSRMSKRVFAV